MSRLIVTPRDVRYALRGLLKSSRFSIIVILLLGLGIGANTAVFTVMSAMLLRPLPVNRSTGLYSVQVGGGYGSPPGVSTTGDSGASFSLAAFSALRNREDVFEELIAFAPLSVTGGLSVRHGQIPEEAKGEEVSGNFFSGLGVEFERGRGFTLADEVSHAQVVVLGYDFWTRSYARNTSVLGQTLNVNGIPMVIVGIATHRFTGVEPGSTTDFWIPLQNRIELNAWGVSSFATTLYGTPNWWCLRMIARLRKDVSPSQAQQALVGDFGGIVRESVGSVDPKEWAPILDFKQIRGISGYRDRYRQSLRILMGLVGLMLLLACTNIVIMIHARNAARQSEFSLRLALGAHRAAIFRQLIAESLLLVSAGAILGWIFALSTTHLLSVWSRSEIGLSPDSSALLFTIAVSSIAVLTFGIAPLWGAVHAPIVKVLHSATSNMTGSRDHIVGARVLLAGQVAVCLVLLMSAMLMLRTLMKYSEESLGLDARNLLVFGITPQGQANTHFFYRSLLDRISRVPGVESASMVENRPGSGWSDNSGGFLIDGLRQRGEILRSNEVGAGFFQTMGIPVVVGRDVVQSDTESSLPITVVNQAFVRKYLPNTNPLGHRIGWSTPLTIVGVVLDSKYTSVDEPVMPMAYFAQMQRRSIGPMQIEVRTRVGAMTVLPDIRKAVAAYNPDLALENPTTQQSQFEESYEQQRVFAVLGAFFGVLAGLLVATGLYGAYSGQVSRRTTEIGLRMALGATRIQVLLMVMRESLWVLIGGLAVGIPLTLAAVRPLASTLYRMSTLDLPSLMLAILSILVVSGLATLIPARRASSIEPMQALRER